MEINEKVISEFKAIIEGVEIDRQQIYYDMTYLLKESGVFDELPREEICNKEFMKKFHHYVESRVFGDDWQARDLENELFEYEKNVVEFISNNF